MKRWCLGGRDLGEDWFPKLGAAARNSKVSSLQVTDGQACRIRVYKVSGNATTVCEDGGLILSLEQVAVVYQQTSGDAVAERLRFELLELLKSYGVDV